MRKFTPRRRNGQLIKFGESPLAAEQQSCVVISERDLKKLWGRAAGHCSAPGCGVDCIPFLDPKTPTVIGEMAHVIPRSKDWIRGDGANEGEDTYENRILLCPTCHTKVDKAPEGTYPRQLLLDWKAKHEAQVAAALKVPRFDTLPELAGAIEKLLQENYFIWKKWGPDSALAEKNPFSSGARIWGLQKLSTVIPNNTRIVWLLRKHEKFIPTEHWKTCVEFVQHASAFEQNAYTRMDSEAVPRFPREFAALMMKLASTR